MFFAKRSGVTWLVVFLGNPGTKYDGTRHNAGFLAADALEKKSGIRINKLRFRALTTQVTLGGESVLLMKPQTFMNLSGEAVIQAVNFYKIAPDHVLVVSDDVSLPAGKMRIRARGSAGGHNGLKSIIQHLGTDAFPRIKLGVGAPPHPEYEMADWVLGSCKGQDAEALRSAALRAADALETYIREGADTAMNKFN